jgi:flavodoxin I
MKALVVYDSLYGNTEQVAEQIAGALKERAEVRAVRAEQARPEDFEGLDLLALGGPTQGHGASATIKTTLERIPQGLLNGVAMIAFDTRYRKPEWLTGSAAGKISEGLLDMGCWPLLPEESFFIATSKGPLEEGELERAAAWARTAMDRLEALAPAVF